MNLSRILIDQQFAALGVRTRQAQLNITTHRPQMTVETTRPVMSVEREAPSFEVNWKKVFDESGLMRPDTFRFHFRDVAINNGFKMINEYAREGEFYAKVEQGGNRIAQYARHKEIEKAQVDINIASMPRTSPEVKWNPGSMQVSWSRHSIDISVSGDYLPEVIIDPTYSIEVYLREQPYISITVAEDALLPTQAGYNVDVVR